MRKNLKILKKKYYNASSLNKSEVEYTFTVDCFLNDFSSDHSGHFRYKARAKYGISFECLAKPVASLTNEEYSDAGTKFTNSKRISFVLEKSAPEGNFLLSEGSFRSNSSFIQAGACNTIFSDNKIFLEKEFRKKPAIKGFASTTIIIYFSPCLFAMPSFIFSDNTFTSPSVSELSAVRASSFFNNLSLFNFSANNDLITSDQLISLNDSISCFKSSGIDKVTFKFFISKIPHNNKNNKFIKYKKLSEV